MKKKIWTLEDVVHFIIYRELDKLNIINSYEKATKICNELRAAVVYRTNKSVNS